MLSVTESSAIPISRPPDTPRSRQGAHPPVQSGRTARPGVGEKEGSGNWEPDHSTSRTGRHAFPGGRGSRSRSAAKAHVGLGRDEPSVGVPTEGELWDSASTPVPVAAWPGMTEAAHPCRYRSRGISSFCTSRQGGACGASSWPRTFVSPAASQRGGNALLG
jgi:hypothetical protein